jgi:XTP/dITP diphosphohydrolase
LRRLLLATRNPGKLRELAPLLQEAGIEKVHLETLDEHPEVSEVEETGITFEANAREKATAAARMTGLWALGEDSGLEVVALGGAPGVRSARFAGPERDDAANNRRLVRELEGVDDRRARYVCVAVLASPDGAVVEQARGTCGGTLTHEPRGTGGFGYDPYFVPDGAERTMAELSPSAQAALSHRGQALRALVPGLRRHLAPECVATRRSP